MSSIIIAGDGYAYVPYQYAVCGIYDGSQDFHVGLLRADSSGAYNNIGDFVWNVVGAINPCEIPVFSNVGIITNADQGVVLTWESWEGQTPIGNMAVTSGASASVVSAPQVPGGGFVSPVLQAQDGSFVGTDDNGDMVAFDAGGNVRWIVPNEQPQIATADGGVIGQSGITYDQNGNATGMMAMPTYSWIQQPYVSTGGQVSAAELLAPAWATSYTAMASGNLSLNGTAVGITESVEGMPVFALWNRGPGCQLPKGGGGEKVKLNTTAFPQYTAERLAWISGNYLENSSCQTLLIGSLFPGTHDPGTALSSVYAAVSQQIPFDGLQSNISQYDAGFLSVADLSDPAKVKMFQGAPVCGQFISYRGLYGSVHVTNKVWAASQISSPDGGPVTDVYINTRLANGLSQATVLHEALHNLTGAYDADLETLLGLSPPDLHDVPNPNTDCPIGSICISDLLQKKGCSGPN